jgi:hypothetical protein
VDIPTKENVMEVVLVAPQRTILTQDGLPVLVEMTTREATTAPARLKANLTITVPCEKHGQHTYPLPFAQAGEGVTPEFRLEMN